MAELPLSSPKSSMTPHQKKDSDSGTMRKSSHKQKKFLHCHENNWLVTSSSIYSVNQQTAIAIKGMITTFGGTTQTVSISKGTKNVEIASMWSAEEALGSITSTIMLDESHPPTDASSKDSKITDDDIEDEKIAL
eukprot:1931206-Ditylum_brightwellii.AAC.1